MKGCDTHPFILNRNFFLKRRVCMHFDQLQLKPFAFYNTDTPFHIFPHSPALSAPEGLIILGHPHGQVLKISKRNGFKRNRTKLKSQGGVNAGTLG
jgi:hypothetical protein